MLRPTHEMLELVEEMYGTIAPSMSIPSHLDPTVNHMITLIAIKLMMGGGDIETLRNAQITMGMTNSKTMTGDTDRTIAIPEKAGETRSLNSNVPIGIGGRIIIQTSIIINGVPPVVPTTIEAPTRDLIGISSFSSTYKHIYKYKAERGRKRESKETTLS